MYETLRDTLKDRGISVRRVAHMANIASQDLYQALNGKKPFYPGWKKRVAEALQISEAELFDDARGE